jgi:hypothetical protein
METKTLIYAFSGYTRLVRGYCISVTYWIMVSTMETDSKRYWYNNVVQLVHFQSIATASQSHHLHSLIMV